MFGEDSIFDDETPVFLNSNKSAFQCGQFKSLSAALGIEVTGYNFRKIVSTWAQNHISIEIQRAEEEALQHNYNVAKTHYSQNRQFQPQLIASTYAKEQNLFPRELREMILKNQNDQTGQK